MDQEYLQLEIIGLMFIERKKKIRGLTRNNFQYTDKFPDFHLVKMLTGNRYHCGQGTIDKSNRSLLGVLGMVGTILAM